MLPVFGLYFDLPLAIAMTAIVHFTNNIFKLGLNFKSIDYNSLKWFGIPSILFAFGGAFTLRQLEIWQNNQQFFILNKVIGLLLILFALFELYDSFKKLEFSKNYLILGGALSGFFGGLSGHQGALRSAFLSKMGLSKEQFISTGIAIACLVDISRLTVYWQRIQQHFYTMDWRLIGFSIAAAIGGALLGKQLLNKITLQWLQWIVALALITFGIYLFTKTSN